MDLTPWLHIWPDVQIPPFAGVWPTAISLMDCRRPTKQIQQSYYCFHIVLRGEIRMVVGASRELLLTKGNVFMTSPEFGFYYKSVQNEEDTSARILWVRLIGPLVKEFFSAMGFDPDNCIHFMAHKPDVINDIFLKFLELINDYQNHTDFEVLSLLYNIPPACRYIKPKKVENPSLIQNIREFMETELERGLNIEQICAAFHISRSGLFRIFKAEYGISPVKHLEKVRIEKAKQLLSSTKLPVKKIALMSGYSSDIHLIRVFKSNMGITPTVWRKEAYFSFTDHYPS